MLSSAPGELFIPLKAPRGDTAASHTLARLLRKARAEKEGIPGKRSVPHLSSCVAECGKHTQRKAGGLEAPQSSLEAPKSRPGGSEIEPWGLQNRAWSPPRRHFEKRFNLRSLRGGGSNSDFCDFWLTWLHLGGPRGFKIEAKTLKNGCWKTSRFQHRF